MTGSTIRKLVIGSAVLVVSLPVLFFLTFAYVIRPVAYQGSSMLPAINDGDRMFIQLSFWKPERGDIVAFHYPLDPSKIYIKRIVGMPGEVVEIRDGQVRINGNTVEESYVDPRLNSYVPNTGSIQIAERHYYILGDNRDNSSDSRAWG